MIFVSIFSVLTILCSIFYSFTEYRCKKGTLTLKKSQVNTIFLSVVFSAFAILALVYTFLNFCFVTVLLFFVAAFVDVFIYILTLWLVKKNMSFNKSLQWVFGAGGIVLAFFCFVIGMYYLIFYVSEDLNKYTIIKTTEYELNNISTEERYLACNAYASEEKIYFMIVNDSSSASSNKKYVFYVPANDKQRNEATEEKVLESNQIKINYIGDGESPYYQKVEYVYEYKRENDKVFKIHRTETIYNVFIPKDDITYIDISS